MLSPLLQNNLEYPQPSIVLDSDRVHQNAPGSAIGLISIRGLTSLSINDPRFEIRSNSTLLGFIDGLLKLKSGEVVSAPEPFDLVISGTVLLDDSAYSATYTITPILSHATTRLEITIALQLEVLATNKIIVPGCEPTSALSSTALSSWLAEGGCGNALVNVSAALEAIPGSYIKYGMNFNRGNMRQSWFVLPAVDVDCPCDKYPDYYAILKDLANEELPVEESFDSCDTMGMGYCPSPDFDEVIAPPNSPYKDEGSFPAGVGVLPPIPPWGLSGT